MQDANWNVVAVATPAAVMQERYAYSPYGVPVFLTGTFTARASSNFNWECLFTGQTYDTQSGLHYFRNRMLHSQVGTFITRDPIGYADGLHLYRAWFVPRTTDPTGMFLTDKCKLRVCRQNITRSGISVAVHLFFVLEHTHDLSTSNSNDEFFHAGPDYNDASKSSVAERCGKCEVKELGTEWGWLHATTGEYKDEEHDPEGTKPPFIPEDKRNDECQTIGEVECDSVEKCLASLVKSLNNDCCIAYSPSPKNRQSKKKQYKANSNSWIAWGLQKCAGKKLADIAKIGKTLGAGSRACY